MSTVWPNFTPPNASEQDLEQVDTTPPPVVAAEKILLEVSGYKITLVILAEKDDGRGIEVSGIPNTALVVNSTIILVMTDKTVVNKRRVFGSAFNPK